MAIGKPLVLFGLPPLRWPYLANAAELCVFNTRKNICVYAIQKVQFSVSILQVSYICGGIHGGPSELINPQGFYAEHHRH